MGGSGSMFLTLVRDEIELPRLLDMGKSAPPGVQVSSGDCKISAVFDSRPTSPSACSISWIAWEVRICESRPVFGC